MGDFVVVVGLIGVVAVGLFVWVLVGCLRSCCWVVCVVGVGLFVLWLWLWLSCCQVGCVLVPSGRCYCSVCVNNICGLTPNSGG